MVSIVPVRNNRHIEDSHQKRYFNWAKSYRLNPLNYQCPVNSYLSDVAYHPANGGKRNEREGARLKAQGVLAGIPDIVIPISASGYNQLYIELKPPIVKGRKKMYPSKVQKLRGELLSKCGNLVVVAYGSDEAIAVTKQYLNHEYMDI